MKKLISVILSITMIMVIIPTSFAEDEIKITYNGEVFETDTPPVIVSDRTLVPVRGVFEAIGATVEWYEEIHQVSIHREVPSQYNSGNEITDIRIYIGYNEMSKHHRNSLANYAAYMLDWIELEVPAQIINDRTMIPVRAVAEAMDITVDWDEETQTVILTEQEAPAATEAPETTVNPVVTDSTFAFRLKEQMPTDRNYMVSPFSIKVALAMVANAAGGTTQREILDTLGIDNLDEFNEYVKVFIEENNSAKQTNDEADSKEEAVLQKLPEFELANSIWFNEDYYKTFYDGPYGSYATDVKFSPEFESVVAEYYDGGSEIVNNENAVETINGWISEKTRGKITGVLDNPKFLASLVNAIYMKAQWAQPFDEDYTMEGDFADRDGKKTKIDFMNDTNRRWYYSDGDTQMVCLPYYGGFSMYVVLGDSSKFMAERGKMESRKVHVKLPKWKTENTFELNGILNTLGIETAFDKRKSDLGKMMINQPKGDVTYIDRVTHKTFIEVDENKTEAAAVTVIHIGASGATLNPPTPEPIIDFIADEPFTYFICDDSNGEILFMGEYAYAK